MPSHVEIAGALMSLERTRFSSAEPFQPSSRSVWLYSYADVEFRLVGVNCPWLPFISNHVLGAKIGFCRSQCVSKVEPPVTTPVPMKGITFRKPFWLVMI